MQSNITNAQSVNLNPKENKVKKLDKSSYTNNKFLNLNQISNDKYVKSPEIKTSKNKVFCRSLYFNGSQSNVNNYSELAKSYKDSGDYKNAVMVYNKMLANSPNDKEVLTLIGQCYKESGDNQARISRPQDAKKCYQIARQYYMYCIKDDSKYDYALRSLKEDNYAEMALTNPKKADQIVYKESKDNLEKAFQLAKQNIPNDLAQTLNDLDGIYFDRTNSLSNYRNIAQYDPENNDIVVSDEYALAAPEVLAPYLAHESVHAKDHDDLTSIREEQDAYRAGVKCWQKVNNGIQDPELDYINKLYKESPQKLDDKIRETYKARDKKIPEVSPYHGMDIYSENTDGLTDNNLYCRFLPINNSASAKEGNSKSSTPLSKSKDDNNLDSLYSSFLQNSSQK